MKSSRAIVLAVSLAMPVVVSAQDDANIVVTVQPTAFPGQAIPTAANFLVCAGSVEVRTHYGVETTSVTGIADQKFRNLPVNITRVVTVQKSGFVGEERTITFQSGNNPVTVQMRPGSGGPACVGPSTSPRPATAPRRLTVRVVGGRASRPVRGAYVCVATGFVAPLRFRNTKQTDANGLAVFDGLPANAPWGVIASSRGSRGVAAVASPHPPNVTQTVSISPGSGQICPNAPLELTGTPIFPVAPDARLGEERMSEHGWFDGGHVEKELNCKQFGDQFVMVGVRGRDGWAVDELSVGCAAVLSGGAIDSNVQFTETFGGGGGESFEAMCESRAVSGIFVYVENEQVHGLGLRCKTLLATGLTTGFSDRTDPAGGNGELTNESCSGGRPARGLRLAASFLRFDWVPMLLTTSGIVGVQLICEQPAIQ
ncbi:MAG TPA: hypothetical protein VM939_01445 [Gemmatimonadaceae bacterium]|nr:hypothetical protein [Gemmatimonadaceae bacterium]